MSSSKSSNRSSNRSSKTRSFSTLAAALGLSAVMALPVQAQTDSEWTPEKTGVLASTSIAGAVLGGPVGFVLGVAAGDWLGNSVNSAQTADSLKQERDQALARLTQLESELTLARQQAGRYQTLVLDSLQLNVMFRTADASLTVQDQARLNVLVRLLNEKPEVQVKLAGFADPRGQEQANMELSRRRAESVQRYLVSRGIADERIIMSAYGASLSSTVRGNLDGYALERVVTIKLQDEDQQLAAHE